MSKLFQDPYALCACGSGKKIKFCCAFALKNPASEEFARYIATIPVDSALHNITGGLASVIVMRHMPNDFWIAGIYVVDIWCLGVKDTFIMDGKTRREIEARITRDGMEFKPLSYEDARSLVFGAVRYAQGLGFKPHADFNIARNFIEPQRSFADTYTFGHNGKPLFIEGPYDRTERDYRYIISQVNKASGNTFTTSDMEAMEDSH